MKTFKVTEWFQIVSFKTSEQSYPSELKSIRPLLLSKIIQHHHTSVKLFPMKEQMSAHFSVFALVFVCDRRLFCVS